MKILICTILIALASCRSVTLEDRVALLVTVPIGCGSGFPLSTTEVITAWHVVQSASPSTITVNGQNPIRCDRLGILDVAVLTFTEPHGLTPWPLDVRPVRPAERVYASGWGVGLHWWSEGLGTRSPGRLSLTIAPGDSGGPVLDSDMEVLGIVVARGQYAGHHCFIVPMTEIASALQARVDLNQ